MWVLLLAGFMAAAPSTLETARDAEDRPALEKMVADYSAAAAKAPKDAEAQYRGALACSYLAEIAIEQRDRKLGQQTAERGMVFGERAITLKPESAEYYRVLGTLYGQAIIDLSSGLNYGPKAKEAINKAVEKAPKSSAVYVARGVGNYYLPAMLGGGPKLASDDFRKAIQLDSKNAEAYLWLGLSLRKENKDAEARQAFTKSLELNPNRFWTRQQLAKMPGK
jgi:tetratricopeptide (TPR) repeat protein